MSIHVSACFVSFVLSASVWCVLVCTSCAACAIHAFHTCVVSIICCIDAIVFLLSLMVEPCTNDLNCGMQLQCTYIHGSLLLGLATITLDVTGFWSFAMRPFCASQFTGLPHTPRLRSQAHTDSQKQQLQRTGIMNFGSPVNPDFVACCLMLVASRPISQQIFPAFSYSSARRYL
ncbi:TPA: hypothetical protein ACH3X2_011484 [Trebouxia sp. C0005]